MLPHISWNTCKQAFARWNRHDGPRLGAALAFYTLLSLAPLLLFIVAMVGFVFGQDEVRNAILTHVHELVGQQGTETVTTMLQHAQRPASGGLLAGTVGVITLLFGASGVFAELRTGLNVAWDLPSSEGTDWKAMAKSRLFAFGMVLAIGFVMLVSLVISTILATMVRYFRHLIPFSASILEVVNFLVSIYVIALLFALIFKYVPRASLPWREVWTGAVLTSLLFTVGKILLGFYLGMAAVGSAYGAAGSLVAVVVWVYYSAQIFYYGAELTWVHSKNKHGQMAEAAPEVSRPNLSRAASA